MKKRKKIGLALGSGGIRGLAHIGVIQKLIEHNIPIDYIAGSSIGAWVGAHYALFQNIEQLIAYTVGKKKEKIFSLVEPTMNGGLIKGEKTTTLLDQWLEHKKFSDAQLPLSIVATDLLTGKTVVFNQGNVARAVRASISVPTMFTPVPYRSSLLIDGGVSNPVPDDIVRNMGADIVISVNLDNWIKNETFDTKSRTSLPAIAARSLNILRHHLARRSMRCSDIILEPYTPAAGISGIADFLTKDTADSLIQNGARATQQRLPDILTLI